MLGAVAGSDYLSALLSNTELVVGQLSDLVTYRLANQKTISAVRQGTLETRHGLFEVMAYQDTTQGRVHPRRRRAIFKLISPRW